MSSQRPFLKVAAEGWNPWSKITKQGNDSLYVEGPMGNILRALAYTMKFDYQVIQPPDHVWGAELSNGSWTGMLGLTQREEVEFALGPFGIYAEREEVVDFTTPFYNDGQAILTARPTINNEIEGFLKPFTLDVWLCILFSLMAVSVILVFIVKVEGTLYNIDTPQVTSKSVLWSLKTIFKESSTWLPDKDGARILVTTWLLASLVFMSSYSGILTAMLTAPKVSIPIDSIQDLAYQNDMPWKLQNQALIFIKGFKEAAFQKVAEDVSGTIPSCWAGREEIALGEYSTICPKTSLKKIISWDFSTSGSCHLYMARELVYNNDLYALAFRTNSPYLDKANEVINRLKNGGLIEHWLSQHLGNITQCMKPPTSDLSADDIRALNIETFGGSFIVLILGYIVSMVAFIMEMLIAYSYKYD